MKETAGRICAPMLSGSDVLQEINSRIKIQMLDPAGAISAAGEVWESLVRRSESIDALYQSPLWFQHLINTVPIEQLSVLRMEDAATGGAGFIPLIRKPYTLEFQAMGRRVCRFQMDSVQVIGSEPLSEGFSQLHESLFNYILTEYPRCEIVYHNSVSSDSEYGRFLAKNPELGFRVRCYRPDGFRRRHCIRLPESMRRFMLRFPVKRRHNLKRASYQLQSKGNGDLRLTSVTSPESVERFLETADRINRASWQFRDFGAGLTNDPVSLKSLHSAASLGFLRSYLLEAGDQPVAYALGYLYHDIYYYVEPRFDPEFRRFSPGQVLLLKLIEDLIKTEGVHRVNLGVGDQRYKEQFADIHYEDSTVLLGRRTFLNNIRFACHSSLRFAVTALKRTIGHSDPFRR
jgi:CelD/BcsL family acetyltransferase involved in cellulose biosynthesis